MHTENIILRERKILFIFERKEKSGWSMVKHVNKFE